PHHVKAAFLEFYHDKAQTTRVNFSNHLAFKSISPSERISLEGHVSVDEIREALLKHDVERFVMDFFATSRMPMGVNSAFITLIPKIPNPGGTLHSDRRCSSSTINKWGKYIGATCMHLSHFFADDVAMLSEWNQNEIVNIIGVLEEFYQSSSLKINIQKSNVYGIRVSNKEIEAMSRFTGCSPGIPPFTYLGLPIGSSMNYTVNWQKVIDKFKARLSAWKANLLSIGGRLTLIKAVLGSIASFEKGGLGVGSLKAFNLALLQKWRWRLVTQPDMLWVKLLKAIHGTEACLDLKGCSSNGVWAKIVGLFNTLHSSGILANGTLKCKVGDGASVRFWKDTWLGDEPLSIRYNRLFRLGSNEECLIKERLVNGSWSWSWKRLITSGRTGSSLMQLMDEVSQLSSLSDNIPDSWQWMSVAVNVWRLIRLWRDAQLPVFNSVTDGIDWIDDMRKSNVLKERMYVIAATTWWMPWKFRNNITFNTHTL
ncbi:hypothetical protein Tco_1024285, partial [Tanacetum coccineum]